jgi:hypothetical protein
MFFSYLFIEFCYISIYICDMILEQPIASTSYATQPTLGMSTVQELLRPKFIRVRKNRETIGGYQIRIPNSFVELQRSVSDKLYKGKIASEKIKFLDSEGFEVDDITLFQPESIYFSEIIENE